MRFSASQIATLLQGEVEGDPHVWVDDLAKIEEGKPGTLTFLANLKYTDHIYTTGASVAVVAHDFSPTRALPSGLTLIRVNDPRASFGSLLKMTEDLAYERTGIEQPSFISPTASIASGVYIGAFCHIADGAVIEEGAQIFPHSSVGREARVGRNTRIHNGVHIYHRCVVGAHCIIHSGTIIGADGFGFALNPDGTNTKIPQVGNVVIEDHVEIGANTTIDRATMGSTLVRQGAKLDNLIQVGHNAEIGAHTVIAAQTGIAGSTKVGAYCQIGGQVGIAGHLVVGDRVRIAAQSGIASSVPDGAVVQGSPAFPIGEYKRAYIAFRNGTKTEQRLTVLEKEWQAQRDH
jgi:UDP-3-O-[3-hydroxymyristoyl] glucosamine N-acyltransferase